MAKLRKRIKTKTLVAKYQAFVNEDTHVVSTVRELQPTTNYSRLVEIMDHQKNYKEGRKRTIKNYSKYMTSSEILAIKSSNKTRIINSVINTLQS